MQRAFAASRVLRMVAPTKPAWLPAPNKYGPTGIKKTTSIPGLPVVVDPRNVLINLYTETLEEVKILPENNAYRKAVESITKFRKSVVEENECIEKIENIIENGQVEELIEVGKNEFGLIKKYFDEKVWEQDPMSDEDWAFSLPNDFNYHDPDLKALQNKFAQDALLKEQRKRDYEQMVDGKFT